MNRGDTQRHVPPGTVDGTWSFVTLQDFATHTSQSKPARRRRPAWTAATTTDAVHHVAHHRQGRGLPAKQHRLRREPVDKRPAITNHEQTTAARWHTHARKVTRIASRGCPRPRTAPRNASRLPGATREGCLPDAGGWHPIIGFPPLPWDARVCKNPTSTIGTQCSSLPDTSHAHLFLA